VAIDQEQGILEVSGLDAFDKTPVIDIKAYIPCCDRVKVFSMPEWVRHWPEWRPEEDEIEIVSPDTLRPGDSERLAALTIPLNPPLEKGEASPPFLKGGQGGFLQTALLNNSPQTDPNNIFIRGARTHNLKNINVMIPHKKFTVITGVSGSGKSSLAFDTIYAEGQCRYMEGLSSQARQILDQMEKPDVEQILGLNPTIAIEQKTVSRNPRSTVGTITQVYDFLRVLFSRIGTRHCPQCGRTVKRQTARQMTKQLAALIPGTQFHIQGQSQEGQIQDTAPRKEFVVPNDEAEQRGFYKSLFEAVETGLKTGNGTLVVTLEDGEDFLLTEHDACPYCARIFFGLTAALFSFNNPDGMCPDCNGLGVRLNVDPGLIVTDPGLSLLDGASPWYGDLRKVKPSGNWMRSELFALADHLQIDLELPWKDLPQNFRDAALYGSGDEIINWTYDMKKRGRSISFERPVQGAVNNINRLLQQTDSVTTRKSLLQFTQKQPCPTCQGERLCPEARFVTLGGWRYPEVATMTIAQIHQWVVDLPGKLTSEHHEIAHETLMEIRRRLQSLVNVGLHYLTLDRSAPTLSGGEGQRIRLATQLGGGLTGLLYILDEPSIGLHPRDHRPLLDTLRQLQDEGNTIVVVEHDADTMRAADWLIDLGPGAGVLGGELVAVGTPEAVTANSDSLTGRYLSGELQVTSPNGKERRKPQGWLSVAGARLHNLKGIDVRFPLGMLTCTTGVSGSGKSSLVAQTLAPALARDLNGAQDVTPGTHDLIDGAENLDKLITITQTPIGRTPRSNPGTYVGVFDEIRKVFANTSEAKARKYKANRFSFNSKGGRCEACQGDGRKRIEMHFLPDVWVTCTECHGQRFNRETLEITYNGKTIADVLDMDVQEALKFFARHPKIKRILQTLRDVGLEYIKLGQSALTLSGGEAQRVKLAKELCRPDTGRTLYILDEPTTGLHFADIQKLLDVLHRLTDAGNTVIIIEHNLDVIKTADWIIDLGPEGGDEGGYIVAQGTPEKVAQMAESYTGQFLKQVL
jgi:excinuclease ABC subunit A